MLAENAYLTKPRSEWWGRRKLASEIMRMPRRERKLGLVTGRVNRLSSAVCFKVAKAFAFWKRSERCRQLLFVIQERSRPGMEFKCICWNSKRLAALSAG